MNDKAREQTKAMLEPTLRKDAYGALAVVVTDQGVAVSSNFTMKSRQAATGVAMQVAQSVLEFLVKNAHDADAQDAKPTVN